MFLDLYNNLWTVNKSHLCSNRMTGDYRYSLDFQLYCNFCNCVINVLWNQNKYTTAHKPDQVYECKSEVAAVCAFCVWTREQLAVWKKKKQSPSHTWHHALGTPSVICASLLWCTWMFELHLKDRKHLYSKKQKECEKIPFKRPPFFPPCGVLGGGCLGLSQLYLGKDRVRPWTSHQLIPFTVKCDI